MQIHHIDPEATGGGGEYENGIPVCLDCHAEVESRSNMGRQFTKEELREHRDRWFQTVRARPDILMRASQNQTETGPLEALLAELGFNQIAVSDGPNEDDFPVLRDEQFRRAIATNTLAALPQPTRDAVMRAYALVGQVNYKFEELAHSDRSGGRASTWVSIRNKQVELRKRLRELIPRVVSQLETSLGQRAE